MEYLAIIYWIGYAIIFLSLIVISGWNLANSEELKRENPNRDIGIFNIMLNLFIFPFFSWLLILIIAFALLFESARKNKNERENE